MQLWNILIFNILNINPCLRPTPTSDNIKYNKNYQIFLI